MRYCRSHHTYGKNYLEYPNPWLKHFLVQCCTTSKQKQGCSTVPLLHEARTEIAWRILFLWYKLFVTQSRRLYYHFKTFHTLSAVDNLSDIKIKLGNVWNQTQTAGWVAQMLPLCYAGPPNVWSGQCWEDSRRCEGRDCINHKCGEKDNADWDECEVACVCT